MADEEYGQLSDEERKRLAFAEGLAWQSGLRFVPKESLEFKYIPPALFTNEMLEQIRAVVREELQSYRDTAYWEKLTEEQKNAVNEWRSLVGQMLAERIALFQEKYPDLKIETYFRSDVVIKETSSQ